MRVPGTWQLTIGTPIGSLHVDLELIERDGVVSGIAGGQGEDVLIPLVTVTHTDRGERVSWAQQVTKPLRLTLQFDVTVTGDKMTGTARAGRLPSSKVRGTRIVQPA